MTAELIQMIASVPDWLWVLAVFIILNVIFGERTLWDYEVKFPFKAGVGRGKVELECGSKKGSRIECAFEMDSSYQNIPLDIYLNDKKIYTLPADKNNTNRREHTEHFSFDEPKEGDIVTVKTNETELFSGPLVLD